MQSSGVRAAIGFGTIALIVVLFIVLSGGDDESSTTTTATNTNPTTATSPTATTGQPPETKRAARAKRITIRGGRPVGGVERLEYEAGERVRFIVQSDVADEIHVHGYDISRDVEAGGNVRFSFPAKLEGVFEIELEQRHEQIAELRVTP